MGRPAHHSANRHPEVRARLGEPRRMAASPSLAAILRGAHRTALARCQESAHLRKTAEFDGRVDPGAYGNSSGQGSTMVQRSTPFLIFFISVVSPPLRRIQSFTVSG